MEELDMNVGKTDSEKMVHKFRTLESDLDGHTYHQRMPLQNLEKLIGSFLKKQTYLQNSFKNVYHVLRSGMYQQSRTLRGPSRAFKRA